MTIVVAYGNTMVADTEASLGCIRVKSGQPKIVRVPDGSLIGMSGSSIWVQILRQWAKAGANLDKTPTFPPTTREDAENDALSWLWLRQPGALLYGDDRMQPYPVDNPYCIGIETAAMAAFAAMDAGANAVRAVEIAIKRNYWVGGDLQIEKLYP